MSIGTKLVKSIAIGAFAIGAFFTGPASATTYIYDMFDHRDRGKSNKEYGLRLDYLNPDTFFSALDTNGNSMLSLSYDDSAMSFLLSGQVRRNSDDSLWDVSYGMSGVTDGGGGMFGAFGGSTLTDDSLVCASSMLCGNDSLNIGRKAKASTGLFFGLGDVGNDPFGVVRGSILTASGWVWRPNGYGCCNDWLLEGKLDKIVNTTPVPLPGGLPLLLAGLAGLGLVARRKITA
ncbi:MAG: hypothetical protein AAF557_24100 [Pseudomonadota bacterium]